MYNKNIPDKLANYIRYYLDKIAASSSTETKITLDKYVVIDSGTFDINHLMIHGLTGSMIIRFYFTIKVGVDVIEDYRDIEIPKLINNVFIIEGAMRVPTNTLDNDNNCTIYDTNIRINEFINIEFTEDEHQPGGYLITLYLYDDDEEYIILEGTEENFNKYSTKLALSEVEVDKLKVKLDSDDVPNNLTRDLVLRLIKKGNDKFYDSMIDKKIFSAESNLMRYLWSRDIRKKIIVSMKQKFYSNNRIYLTDIQSAITRYFKVASEKNIDIPSTVNPLIFDALKGKIKIPKTVAFNQTMTDIIDVVNTPINGNVNQINELNVCAVIKDDTIYIKCYEYPSQKPVEVLYTKYCTKRVVSNDSWDYEKKSWIDPSKLVKYKLRMKYRTGSVQDSYDYIEPKRDDKLSITTRRIPLGNISDSTRIAMSANFHKQSLELVNSEPALIATGHDEVDFENSVLLTRHVGKDSIVTKIQGNLIYVKEIDSESISFYEIPSPTPGANDSITSFRPTVKEGQRIKDGDILIIPEYQKRKSFELGINGLTIYMNYLGYTYEDSLIVSESFAHKFTHFSIIDVSIPLYPDDIIRYIKKIGSKVTSKDVLVNNQTKLRVSANIKETYTGSGLLAGMGIAYNQANLIVPNNIDEAYVLDCKIHIDPDRKLTHEDSLKTIDEYLKGGTVDEFNPLIEEKYKKLKAPEIEYTDKQSGYISFKLLRVDVCKVGDKTSNRYGSKGIISLILPDKCMPQIEKPDGTRIPSEVILSPASVIKRKNLSQIYECALTKCVREIYKRVQYHLDQENVAGAKAFLKKFYKDKFEKMTDQEFVNNHKELGVFAYRMEVGFFTTVTRSEILAWMKDLNLKEYDKIYCPDVVIAETPNGRKVFSKEDWDPSLGWDAKHYDLGYCDQECITGETYMLKLWKQANYDGKVTSDVMETFEPIMGRGLYRDEGQMIGEYELWVLLESGVESFVQQQSQTMKQSQYIFLNELLLAGYAIQDKDGNPLLSSSRSKQKKLEQLQ